MAVGEPAGSMADERGREMGGGGNEKRPVETGLLGGCVVGLEPTTTRTTIWCSTN